MVKHQNNEVRTQNTKEILLVNVVQLSSHYVLVPNLLDVYKDRKLSQIWAYALLIKISLYNNML